MEQLLQQIEAYRQEIGALGHPRREAEALEAYRIRFLGTKGIVKNLFQEMKNVPVEKKKEFGQVLNEFKQLAETNYDNGNPAAQVLSQYGKSKSTLLCPAIPLPLGTRHPISLVRNRIIKF